MDQRPTVVDYRGYRFGYRCGYCRGAHTKASHGMWAHMMTVQDYQALIDRGWRRSGKYCYKPTMNETCCPQYTVKCAALDFQLSKSQKKVIKNFNHVMAMGRGPGMPTPDDKEYSAELQPNTLDEIPERNMDTVESHLDFQETTAGASCSELTTSDEAVCAPPRKNSIPNSGREEDRDAAAEKSTDIKAHDVRKIKKEPNKGLGADPNKPKPTKAKALRKERWRQKHGITDGDGPQAKKPTKNLTKRIESFLEEIPANSKHKFEVRLVRSAPCSAAFDETFEESYQVYKKYQMKIHGDPPDKPSQRQFRNFLVDSPLQEYHREGGFPDGYGSFHQHYLIDGKIVAVGVVDILPSSLSSVYLYYDPDYFYLSVGTYSALKEIAFTRYLHTLEPSIKYYYMGFYIHSCPKMRYKGQYYPSFLLCPESYRWVPLESCRPKLDASKYSRLDETGAVDPNSCVNLGMVMILYQGQAMPYQFYSLLNPDEEDKEEVEEYSSLAGAECAQRILLYRSSN